MNETIDNQQQIPTQAELGWLAGIIDGKGSVLVQLSAMKGGTQVKNITPAVTMGNTDKEMIEEYVRIVKKIGAGVHVHRREPKVPTHGGLVSGPPKKAKTYKLLYVAQSVGYMRAKKLLEAVEPYLVTNKKVKAQLIIQYVDQRLSKRMVEPKISKLASYSNAPFDEEDARLMLKILDMQHSKHKPLLEKMLRDFTERRGDNARMIKSGPLAKALGDSGNDYPPAQAGQ